MKDKKSKRKRFIDVVTSVISRAYRRKNDERFTKEPLEILQKKLGNKLQVIDYTDELPNFIENFMNEAIQETKNKGKNLIIT